MVLPQYSKLSPQLSKEKQVGTYVRQAKIGQGTFGKVFKGYHRQTGEQVALKRILMDQEDNGDADSGWQEVKMLNMLQHENVVKLIEFLRIFNDNEPKGCTSYFYLVMELCHYDLESLICNNNLKFSLSEIKNVMLQIFKGLSYIHVLQILHRDIKPANILVTNDGIIKLADFGLACTYSTNKDSQANCYNNNVVTLWYRPPELLLGERNYGPSVDMWSAGCLMAEMWTRIPIMMGQSEQDQLALISTLCGSIRPKNWPEVQKLVLYNFFKLPKKQKRKLKERLGVIVKCSHAMKMLERLLTLDPSKRIESSDVVFHDFFCEDPMPCSLAELQSTLKNFALHVGQSTS